MFELIKEFPAQMREALQIGQKAQLKTAPATQVKNVVVCGLGGSGIGGDLLAELLKSELKVPVLVNKSYFLPAFVDASTLLILSSYSGNTEETVACAHEALRRGLQPVVVTAGGKLEEIARKNNLDLINIPAGHPPRACLGYSFTQLFFILKHFGLINGDFQEQLNRTASFLEAEQNTIMQDAEYLAGKLLQKIIVLYAEDKYESTALRLKQQINENSKMHCWYNVVPEMNHNELVGWKEPVANLAVIIFRSEDEFHRNTQRIIYKKDVIVKLSNNVYELYAKGANLLEKHFYLIHIGDWLSYHLAMLQGIDPVEVNVITNLKKRLDSLNN
jgi:glucose/mannose-6-phosphate isomerase